MIYKSAFIALALVFGTQAFAIYDPSWERPVLRADLVQTDNFGRTLAYSNLSNVEVTLNQRDGSRNPTSISYEGEQQVYCVYWPCYPQKFSFDYKIIGMRHVRRGVTQYFGESVVGDGRYPEVRRITLTEHDRRGRKTWSVTAVNPQGLATFLKGEAEGVITPQSAGG